MDLLKERSSIKGLQKSDVLFGGLGHDTFDCGDGVDLVRDFDRIEDTASSNCAGLG